MKPSSSVSKNTDALTSLISYALPPFLSSDHHTSTNNSHPSAIDINQFTSSRHIIPSSSVPTHPSQSPDLETVSARHSVPSDNQLKPSNNNNKISNNITTNPKDIPSNKESSTKQTTKPILTNTNNSNRNPHHRKKKTVAFGRTVNVSQTIEGSKPKKMSNLTAPVRERKDSVQTALTNEELMTIKQTVDELKNSVDQLKQNDLAKDKLLAELERKYAKQEREMLELSDMMKVLTSVSLIHFNCLSKRCQNYGFGLKSISD
ncbi:unnamed protein product [Anisakis simplex]|uniref:NAM-associated domain-containing protein n=1 Tax=Anisakis simplex TaxID=6269 RepID=A0A0M3K5T6_ANISI|nr:unnamed protein product [Anisakis simplex]